MLVLIIGAGLGGLCAAHGLRKAGIDVQIFERQKSPAEDRSGYGIHIDAHGRRALQKCLPESNWRRFEAVSTPAGTQMFFRGTDLRVLAEKDDTKLLGKTADRIERRGIGRSDLRDILLDGLNNKDMLCIHWGKTFSSFEQLSNGQIRVHFLDYTQIDGDVLLGADGPHSPTRKQYLPQIERLDLGISAIAGICLPTDELRNILPRNLINGTLNNIVPYGNGWMFVSSWTLPKADSNHQMENLRATYLVWAYIVPLRENSFVRETFEKGELKDFVLESIHSWSFGLRQMVTDTDVSTIFLHPITMYAGITTMESKSSHVAG